MLLCVDSIIAMQKTLQLLSRVLSFIQLFKNGLGLARERVRDAQPAGVRGGPRVERGARDDVLLQIHRLSTNT